MAIEEINVVHIQALQGSLGAFDDVLPGEALVIGAPTTPEDLGGYDQVGALPAQLSDGLAHDLFGPPVGVHLGVVEEVYAVVSATLQD